ncbi:MAG: Tim44 domain-containing protein [Desulfovibrionaceae bacterium]|nr:Tim44 domain-containing protein [Desulfovibrionaceae bacterium]
MKHWKVLAVALACAAAFALATPPDADAARLGGGRSFGGSSILSRPAPMPRAPSGSTFRQQQPGSAVNRQAQTGTAAAPAFGGMGGLFGGLLAGSLLGSLFAGHGAAGGGGLFDILIIGLVIYLVMRFLRRRRDASSSSPSASGNPYAGRAEGSQGAGQTGMGWDMLRSSSDAGRNYDNPQSDAIPAGFNAEEFLRGAKMAYVRLQESWDRRDLDDIAQFATRPVMDELRKQLAEDPEPGTTELLMVDASLMQVRSEGGSQYAAVLFDVLMREDPKASQPEQVREVWHFVRPLDGSESWRLDGIQQMA